MGVCYAAATHQQQQQQQEPATFILLLALAGVFLFLIITHLLSFNSDGTIAGCSGRRTSSCGGDV